MIVQDAAKEYCDQQYRTLLYQILSKSDNFSLRYADLAIFKMAAVRHLGFVMTSKYCIVPKFLVNQCCSF